MECEMIIREILKKMKEEKERLNIKMRNGIFSETECRNEYGECDKCIEVVIGVALNNFNKEHVRKMIKECLY